MKRHQIITLIFFVLTWATALQVGKKIHQQGTQLLTELWQSPVHYSFMAGTQPCGESSTSPKKLAAELKDFTVLTAKCWLLITR